MTVVFCSIFHSQEWMHRQTDRQTDREREKRTAVQKIYVAPFGGPLGPPTEGNKILQMSSPAATKKRPVTSSKLCNNTKNNTDKDLKNRLKSDFTLIN